MRVAKQHLYSDRSSLLFGLHGLTFDDSSGARSTEGADYAGSTDELLGCFHTAPAAWPHAPLGSATRAPHLVAVRGSRLPSAGAWPWVLQATASMVADAASSLGAPRRRRTPPPAARRRARRCLTTRYCASASGRNSACPPPSSSPRCAYGVLSRGQAHRTTGAATHPPQEAPGVPERRALAAQVPEKRRRRQLETPAQSSLRRLHAMRPEGPQGPSALRRLQPYVPRLQPM